MVPQQPAGQLAGLQGVQLPIDIVYAMAANLLPLVAYCTAGATIAYLVHLWQVTISQRARSPYTLDGLRHKTRHLTTGGPFNKILDVCCIPEGQQGTAGGSSKQGRRQGYQLSMAGSKQACLERCSLGLK
jgi:hypothetical protein